VKLKLLTFHLQEGHGLNNMACLQMFYSVINYK